MWSVLSLWPSLQLTLHTIYNIPFAFSPLKQLLGTTFYWLQPPLSSEKLFSSLSWYVCLSKAAWQMLWMTWIIWAPFKKKKTNVGICFFEGWSHAVKTEKGVVVWIIWSFPLEPDTCMPWIIHFLAACAAPMPLHRACTRLSRSRLLPSMEDQTMCPTRICPPPRRPVL